MRRRHRGAVNTPQTPMPDDDHDPITEPFAPPRGPVPPPGPWAMNPQATPPPFVSPPPPPPVARQRAGVTKPIIVTALLAGLLGGAVGMGGSSLLGHDAASVPILNSQPAAAANAADAQPGSVTYAASVASKSTADIKVQTANGTAVGSGIVLSPDGYVLTNHHVVAGAGSGSTIVVTTGDGHQHNATVTGNAPSYDLAVIKLEGASGLTPATLGDSDALKVGQQVVAVGSPDSLTNTVTSGIVSALSRTVTAGDASGSSLTVYNGLQTDTPINPGNSGGPLVNLQGQVIAVNSAVDTGQAASGGPQSFGLGFAIPINTAKRIANQLLQDGQATKPVMGVSGSLSAGDRTEGATVSSVQRGGPAADAGIREGDVITKIGDTTVSDYADLMAQILTHEPGETVPVTTGSGSGAWTVQVKLGSAVDEQETTVPESGSGSGGSPLPFGGNPFGQNP
ncbi:PDZ domain-containing protein [Gordonia sp. JH63]|uniref:S1C family serine protease n=1 Tax=Gordonia sp. JH63 TaxID=2698900 RepID=UPI00131FC859|nr:trypsin-like peptidase domain-containing protein [Gordonia sp. JH63]QHD86769.1 PDZ domain-containing protein [Gordonia sp. JH63]